MFSLSEMECDTDHYLVVAKVWERLAASTQAVKKTDWIQSISRN